MINPSILRDYDIRGVVGDTLKISDASVIGRGFGSLIIRMGLSTVAVGWDGRITSPKLKDALIDGLVSAGVRVVCIGLGPSPMLYYAAYTLPTDAGVMVTGSHNPSEYNGFKFIIQNNSFFGEQIQELGAFIKSGKYENGCGKVKNIEILNNYISRLLKDYTGGDDLRVAWDPGNGATGEAVKLLTAQLPGQHILINSEIDGSFPSHHPDPTVPENLKEIQELVIKNSCDIGLSFDGDGDRIGVIDSTGRILWGDQLLTILAGEVLEDVPGAPILCDVKASRLFFEEIRNLGGVPVMWKVGHSHIKSKMKEINAPLAGEMSAHIFFKHRYYGFDDALYAAIRLLSLISMSGESVADKIDRFPKYVNTPELRFFCEDDRKFSVVEEIKSRLSKTKGVEFFDLDGVRVEKKIGWWLIRASNTQPALVARCEANNENDLTKIKNELRTQLLESGVKIPDLSLS